jgi:hypothetical protein
MLVVNTDRPFFERARDYFDVIELALEMDLLVYTPEEFQALTRDPSPVQVFHLGLLFVS